MATTDTGDHDRLARLVQRLRPGGTLLRTWSLEGGVSAHTSAIRIATPDDGTEWCGATGSSTRGTTRPSPWAAAQLSGWELDAATKAGMRRQLVKLIAASPPTQWWLLSIGQ